MKTKHFYIYLIFILFTNNLFANNKINKINFEGNRRYSDLVYNEYINIKVGDNFKQDLTNKIIKDLYMSDLVEDVNVNFKNNILTIDIKEKKFIKKITIIGNKKLKDKNIKENFKLKVKEVFSFKLLNEDLEFVNMFYKSMGLFNTKVEYEIKEDESNFIEVIFKIEESEKTRIKNIYFIGNKKYNSDILKSNLYSKENKLYRFGGKINYNADILEYDSYLLKMFYFSKGYVDFNLHSAIGKFNDQNNTFDVVFDIDEGEQYLFGDVKVIDNVGNIEKDNINYIQNNIISIKSKDIFNIKEINKNIAKITSYLEKNNKKFFVVNMQLIPDKENRAVNLNFAIDKTEKYYIGKIKIQNNIRTSDAVIREQLSIQEGDPFDKNNIDKSMQRIKNLGFFKSVDYKQKDGIIKNQYDIIIDVEEQSTGSFNFGIGYSSSYGLNGNIEVNQNNLFGNGNKLGFGININEYYNNLSLNYRVKNILGTKITWGSSIFYQNLNNIDNSNSNIGYNKLERGLRNYLTFNLSEYLTNTVSYNLKYYELSEVLSDYDGILSNRDDVISEVSLNFSYDKRDNYYNTTRGYLLSYDLSFAGLFGTKDYIKNTLYASYYYPLYLDKIILKLEGKYAKINSINDNPLFPDDGFYLGGYSMRGFESGGVGPRVNSTSGTSIDNYGLSGTTLYYFNTEIKFPLFLPEEFSVVGILFFNAGTVYGIEDNDNVDKSLIYDSNSIRSATGVSIVWQTAFGNLSLDFSKILKKESYDKEETFKFNIGTQF